MSNIVWKQGTPGNWNTPANWLGNIVPNDPAADVSIVAPPVGGPGFYNVTIAAGAADTVHSLDLGSSNIGLEVDGTLNFAPGSAGGLGREFQSSLLAVNNGTIVNAGTVFAFIQTRGNALFTGSKPIYLAWELQVLDGTATVDTAGIAQYDAVGHTLFDGAFDALGSTETINLGGKLGGLAVDVETLTGPKSTPTQSYWTQLIYNDAGSQINEWNGTAYVPIESTLKLIENAAYVTVTDGRNYTTANPFTIGKDGVFEQAGGTLSTGGLTLLSGGLLVGGVSITGPGPTSGRVVVNGAVTNGGQIVAEGPGIVFHDAISGTGEITFNRTAPLPGIGTTVGPAIAGTLEVAGVGAGQTIKMIGNDTLILDNPAAFGGTISGFALSDSIVLGNTHVTRAAYAAATGTLDLFDASTKVDSLTLTGGYAGQTLSFVQTPTGSTVVSLPSEALFSVTSTSGADKITSNPTLIGSASSNAVVTLTENGTKIGNSVTASASGAWSVALPQLAGGQHTVLASEKDGAGNTGTASLTFAVVAVPAPVGGVSTLQVSSTDLAKSLQGNGFLQFAGGTETILLADGRLSVGPDTDEAFVTRLYQGLLGRTPDANGLASWDAAVKGSGGKAAVAQSFINSAEYQTNHPGPTTTQFVSNLYQVMLGRAADAGGLAGWTQALDGGAVTRGQVAAGFADSAESKQHWSGATSGGVFARDSNATIVREDYHAAFGREADTGGLSAWTQFLNGGGTPGQLAEDFTTSSEFQKAHGLLSNSDYVASLYRDSLGRAADAGGLAAWTNALDTKALSRGGVLASIAQSPEAQNHLQWALA